MERSAAQCQWVQGQLVPSTGLRHCPVLVAMQDKHVSIFLLSSLLSRTHSSGFPWHEKASLEECFFLN